MENQLRLGLVAPVAPDQWADAGKDQLVRLVRTVKDLGHDSFWANDSLVRPRFEALTFLSAAAALTRRITLGTAALLPALRRPVQTADSVASIDRLTEGRLVIAVGAGFPGLSEVDYAASEVPWAPALHTTRRDRGLLATTVDN